MRWVKAERSLLRRKRNNTQLWQLKDDVSEEATCREPTALLYRDKERESVSTGSRVTRQD